MASGHAAVFDFSVRAIACISCGAPQSVPPAGGTVSCSHCRSTLVIEARRVEASLPPGAPLPDSAYDLQPFLDSTDCEGKPWTETMPVFRAVWDEARTQPNIEGGYRLYAATLMLSTGHGAQGDQRQRRAVLETALELLPDRGHRCIVRCHLARAANRLGERDAARQWLSECEVQGVSPQVADELRVSEASLAQSGGQHARVLELLPTAEQATGVSASLGAQLRIDALERSGQEAQALAELEVAIERHGADVIVGWLRANELAPRSRAKWRADRASKSGLALIVIGIVGALALAGGLALWLKMS